MDKFYEFLSGENMKTNWKLFIILLIASIFGILAVFPYTLTLEGNILQNLPVPLYVLITGQIIQNTVMFAVVILIGLFLSKKVGLGLPVLEGWLEGREVKGYLKSILGISIGLGILAGVLITGIDYLFSFAGVTINVAQASITLLHGRDSSHLYPYHRFKRCQWNYIWMALLEERT